MGHDRDQLLDAGAADAAASTCGTVRSYQAALTDTWDWSTDESAGATVAVSATSATVQLQPGVATGLVYARVSGWSVATLRNSSVRLQVTDGLAAGNSASQVYFVHMRDQNNKIGFSLRGGDLYSIVTVAGVDRDQYLEPFTGSNSWWQIRHAGDTAFFETGPSAGTVTVRDTATNYSQLDDGYVEFGAGTSDATVSSADTVVFTGFNTGLARDPWCKASALIDDFEGTALGPRWRVTAGTCAAAVSAGQVSLTALGVDGQRCQLVSTSHYDLRESAVSVHVTGPPDAAGVRASLAVRSANYSMELGIDHDQLFAIEVRTDGSVNPMTNLGSAANQSWLRIAADQGVVSIGAAASPSGPWSLSFSSPTTDPLDSVWVELGLSFGYVGLNGSDDYTVSFDQFGYGS